jgi:hypothetical protein
LLYDRSTKGCAIASRHFHVLLSNSRWIRWSRPGAASSAEQQFEVHRSFRRYPALLEKRARRMGLENRVAPRLCYMESKLSVNCYGPPQDHPLESRN